MDGDLMEAFIADGIGSALAEEIVSYGQSEVERLLGYWDLKVSNSYSPGYCDWNVQEQRQFFSLLPENFCKVVLTESCLMLPIKSVSTLMGAGMSIEKKSMDVLFVRTRTVISVENKCLTDKLKSYGTDFNL